MEKAKQMAAEIVDVLLADMKKRAGRNERESLLEALGEPGVDDIREDWRQLVHERLSSARARPKAKRAVRRPKAEARKPVARKRAAKARR